MLTVGVDVGGTTAKAGLVDADGTLLTTRVAATPRAPRELDDTVAGLVGHLVGEARADGAEVAAVGLAVAGFVDPDRRSVSFGAHLPWRDEPVVARMSERLELPVTLEHDANAAGLAEHRVGAAAGARVAVLVALGTGIGAALLVGGTVFRGGFGVAPELGHLVLVPGGRPCPCGKRGCFERYCSGTALGTGADELVSAGEDFTTLRASWERGLPLTGRDVAHAAAAGDALARRVVADFASWLGRGLALVADVFDPDVVVIGGEVSASADLFLDDAVRTYGEEITGRGHRKLARVRPAVLGGDAGMIGAALDARERCAPRP
ncbi:ROK family protein [Actinomycetospora sp. TBRC 11914]|uniref:ROK family protein n=1 Tax=Actinomycetospora sp. TBRC 11914 TaxID=2729387 RepID=UPI00145F68E4|nr:ROK family protein [Actinomycetospora sp. TBRC 11914]NMO93347.1 ROK family protein [Actinomycetospora sp. TBRC 11914]